MDGNKVISEEEKKAIRDYFEEHYLLDADGYSGFSLKTVTETDFIFFLQNYDSFNYHDESWDEDIVTVFEKLTDEEATEAVCSSVAENLDRYKDYIWDYEHFDWRRYTESVARIPGCAGTFRIVEARGNDRAYYN